MRFSSLVRRRVSSASLCLMTVTLMAAICVRPPTFVATAVGRGSLAVADFNGDGSLDFASANWNSGSGRGREVSLRFGDGPADFPIGASFGAPGVRKHLAAADMDNDTDIDLVVRRIVVLARLANAVSCC